MKTKLLKREFFLVFIYITLGTSIFGQGLNCEFGFNDNYNQNATEVVCVDEFTFVSKIQSLENTFVSMSTLSKLDTLGNVIWKEDIFPIWSEYTIVNEMIASENGGVYLLGSMWTTCDVEQDCYWFISKYDLDGNVLWNKLWLDFYCFEMEVSGLSLNNSNELMLNILFQDNSSIIKYDPDGILLDSLNISVANLNGIDSSSTYQYIAFKQDSLYGFDTGGNTIAELKFSSEIRNLKSINDSLFIQTQDSIFIYDGNLNFLVGNWYSSSFTDYSDLKVNDNEIRFLSSDVNNQYVLTMDKDLQAIGSITIPIVLENSDKKDFNDLHFSCGINYNLTEFEAIRQMDFSLQSSFNEFIPSTDIGIVDFECTQFSVEAYPTVEDVYGYSIYGNVLIKNFGTEILTSCRINHKIDYGICNFYFFTAEYENLNLLPGDSTWINLGYIHNSTNYLPQDTIKATVCLFTSHPNALTDLNVPNDEYCEDVILGYAGLTENKEKDFVIYPNPTSDFISIQTSKENINTFKLTNAQGQVVLSGNLKSKQIDLSDLNKGLYLLQVNDNLDQKSFVKYIIKQ